ncbi:MAG: hydrogenase accessory protein [Bradyrhizobium sp.]|jgi:hydrogenase-1 operon protein HyaE|uniref:Hydrogenase expression/formation protein n=1 Tax=Bradyrhizobium denitrificans TaxID=2734912 RepID=A0ABS5GL59_9BRAD|nr:MULTISPECIES: hydrogenase accessory protein [Bradyrhizobium]RTM04719.1 MAG: hydrogenase accessory protein [Bradyrhizobiaceae bacterium]ABQ34192.1 Hydrogenase expression/formation [Bradyrhizobium sp. BTAi1]MBR1141316.1 hydrogenase accessory protein [Bradyrhizobium denitrificans]MCL8488432.1 hydrogenase accessory protein [Bradyrhizobium denitrificans]MDU0955077.1 hydrogenase accessory protein [Bradyrhizobium sp.]
MDVQQRAAARRQGGLPEVDVSTVDAFLADVDSAGAVAVLLSAGDPARFPEALDVAIVLPELITAFQGRLRGALIAREAEAELGARFGVRVQPSLILCRGTEPIGLIAKIQDWSVYVDRISRLIDRPVGAAATVVASIVPAHQTSGAGR